MIKITRKKKKKKGGMNERVTKIKKNEKKIDKRKY